VTINEAVEKEKERIFEFWGSDTAANLVREWFGSHILNLSKKIHESTGQEKKDTDSFFRWAKVESAHALGVSSEHGIFKKSFVAFVADPRNRIRKIYEEVQDKMVREIENAKSTKTAPTKPPPTKQQPLKNGEKTVGDLVTFVFWQDNVFPVWVEKYKNAKGLESFSDLNEELKKEVTGLGWASQYSTIQAAVFSMSGGGKERQIFPGSPPPDPDKSGKTESETETQNFIVPLIGAVVLLYFLS